MRVLSRESRGGSEPARLRPYPEAQYGDCSGRRYGESYEERASQGFVLLAIRSDEGDARANPVPLAEGSVALLLSLAKRVVQNNNEFLRGVGPGVLLKGKKAGILGLGSIARACVKEAYEEIAYGVRRFYAVTT